MRNAIHHGVHCLLHHGVVALFFVLLIYVLGVGWFVDASGSLLTGASVAEQSVTGRLDLKGDLMPYLSLLSKENVFLTPLSSPPGGQILVSGYQKDVLPALLKAAELAQSRGHLVSYSLSKE